MYYDARIGRWGATDPLFEKHINYTPYNYVLNRPLVMLDPDGNQAWVIEGLSAVTEIGEGLAAMGAIGEAVGSSPALLGAAIVLVTPNTAEAPGIERDRNLIQVKPDIDNAPLQSSDRTKSGGKDINGSLRQIGIHIDKLMGRGKPSDGDPNDPRNRNDWYDDIKKHVKEVVKAVKKITKGTGNPLEYIQKLINQGKVKPELWQKILEEGKQLPVKELQKLIE